MRAIRKARIGRIERMAESLHAGQVDKQGVPYIEHIRAVADAVSPAAKPVALFHDALEDRRASERDLAAVLSPVEMDAVRLVTRDKDRVTYTQFIDAIAHAAGAAGQLAREVKIADLEHNLGRITPGIDRAKPALRVRYQRALERLR